MPTNVKKSLKKENKNKTKARNFENPRKKFVSD
jgi:hypothetical protein